VSFSSAGSYDLDGDGLTFRWSFGDGASAQGATATHTYGTADPVQVTLTATDQLGASSSSTATVYPANHTPQLTVNPPAAHTYRVGEDVGLTATATDYEDGNLVVQWDTALLHCPFAGSCHRHPEGTTTGPTYSAKFTDHGADTTMLVTAHVQDSRGAVASTTFEAKPDLRNLAVNSPVPVNINGETSASTQVVAGSSVQLAAPLTSAYWRFQNWSDGGAAAHSFTMPDADRTMTAGYITAIATRYAALGGASSSLGSPTSTEYDAAGGRTRNYTGGRLYWSPGTAVHTVSGAILPKYLAAGGPASLGFPTTDVVAVKGGWASSFTGARIYWSSATGAHSLGGPILAKYLAAGGPNSYGLPSTDVVTVPGGSYAHFSGGRSIFWSGPTQARLVYGPIRTKYAAMGYQKSCLGFPTTDRYAVTGGYRNRFTGGMITYTTATAKTVSTC
jgi:uncharacterized protein with LGFP repeats